jgi:hypothetical protein
MKTNPILAVLLFVVTNVNAQYFQKMYNINTTSNDLAGKGVNEVLTGGNNLHMQAGTSIFAPSGTTVNTTAPMVAVTDFSSALVFCAAYPFPLLNGNTVLARGRAIARDPNTGELIVLGDFTSTPTNTTGVFFFRVTAGGAVVAGSLNYFFHPNNRAINAAAIKIVPGATTQIVACGRAESAVTSGSFNPWVARYDVNFNLGWFRIYDEIAANVTWNARANDLIETSFTSTSTASEIGVVGEQLNAGNYRGFLMRLTTAGSLINYTSYDLGATTDDRLTSITKCNNTVPAVGYIMAGYTNINGTTTASPKVWAIRTNSTGVTVNWSNRYTYPNGTASCFANGIVERNNTGLGVYEYYISGTTTLGVIGAADVILYKVAPNGTLPGNNVVTIGTIGAINEFGINIDKSDVGTSTWPGLTIYGQREISPGNNDFYKIKCYFNGKITIPPSCKDTVNTASIIAQTASTVSFVTPTVSVAPKVQPNPSIVNGNQTLICNTATITGGSNARMMASTSNFESAVVNGELAVNAYPNPLRNNQDLQLAINSPQDELTTLTVINLLGQVVYSSSKDMKAGLNTIQLTLPELKEGIYTVNITSGKLTKNVLISLTN